MGVPESSKGTLRHIRNRVGEILSSVDSFVTSRSIHDCFRLGKYDEGKQTRPLLVKLTRANDAQSILKNRKELASRPEITVKPDLPPAKRKVQSILLKERWSLINLGESRSDIRISGNSLYLRRDKYGTVREDKFEKYTPTIVTQKLFL